MVAKTEVLKTDRLVLRRFRTEDAVALAGYRSDPATARYQSWDAPFPLAAAAAMVAELAEADPLADGWFQYAVTITGSDELIGDVGVRRHDDGRQAEIGFTFAPGHCGHGYAREAVAEVAGRLFTGGGAHRLHACCDARNVRSARLLERVGFRREGHLVQSTWIKGEWTDDLLYAMLAGECLGR